MTKMLAVVVILLLIVGGKSEATEINCERSDKADLLEKICYLNKTTMITANNVTFPHENSDVETILLDNNKKVKYLPVKVYKFPNLKIFLARNLDVKEISASNFERLSNLKLLDLGENQIESIPNYCFEGLNKLNRIFLGEHSVNFQSN